MKVAGLVGAKGPGTLKELPTHTRRCPAGHPMALDWAECPYCKAERSTSEARQLRPVPAAANESCGEAALAPTRLRGETLLAGRQLTGVVFTFTWQRTGQLYPVYAGRNYLGAAPTTPTGARTDILLTEDSSLSGTHCLILYQSDTGLYRIADENSANGTFVNGEPIDSRGRELPDDAQILAGKTLFTFRKVRAPAPGLEDVRIPRKE
jgi:hypothetical protein